MAKAPSLPRRRVTSLMYSCSPKISIATRMTGGFCAFAGGEPGGVGVDRVGADRSGGERVTGGGRSRGRQEEAAARQRIDLVCESLDIGHELGLSGHTKPPCLWRGGSSLRIGDTPSM